MRRRTMISGVIAVPLLASCTDADTDDGAASSPSDGGGRAGTAGTVEHAGEVRMLGGTVELILAVRPLVRSGGHLVLTLDVSAEDPDDELGNGPISALYSLVSSDYVDARPFDGIRLLDLAGGRVAGVAMDAEGQTLRTEPAARWKDRDGAAGTESLQLVFADLGRDAVAVLIPKGGLLDAVPVHDGEVPAVDAVSPLDLGALDRAPLGEMLSYSEDLVTRTRTESTTEASIVRLTSDVLFDSSSAVLGPEAQAVIEQAAETIARHEPGPVQVVGHTDSIDDEAFNQTLSEQRAQAVADALGPLLDTAAFPLEVSGRGESEPIADNGSSEGRAVNRRVELSIATPEVVEATVSTELPEIDGPVGTGEEGIELEKPIPVRVRAPQARIVEDHLVVRLELTRLDDSAGTGIGIGDSAGDLHVPDHVVLLKSEGGVAVMNGSVAMLPALHRVDGEDSAARPLTDLRTNATFHGGRSRIDEIVYPGGLPVGDTVTLQLVRGGWRLTDVAVQR